MTGHAQATVTVICKERRTTLTLAPDETVLSGLARQGYRHRHGCRRGGCGTCKVDVTAGAVRYGATVSEDVLSCEERGAGVALSCRAIPATPHVELRLRDDTLTYFLPWHLPPVPPAGRAAPTTKS